MKIKYLFLVIVPVAPLILRMLYLPIEEIVLLRGMDWTSESINSLASKVFMPVAYIGSLLFLIRMSFQIDGLKKRYIYLLVGGLIQIMLTLLCMSLYVFRGINPSS